MIQEKYNQLIYDLATEKAIEIYSHTRANILSPVNIKSEDTVSFLNEEIVSVVEYLKEKASEVSTTLTDNSDYVIAFGKLNIAPSKIKKSLKDGGAFVMASDNDTCDLQMLQTLCQDAGYKTIDIFYAAPDYKYAMELFSSEYTKDTYS